MTYVPIRAAATLAVVRDGEPGLEVCVIRRSTRSTFVGGAYVFPGGAVDPADEEATDAAWVRGSQVADADAALGEPFSSAAHRIAAVRETLEECGLLVSTASPGGAAIDQLDAVTAPLVAAARTGGSDALGALLEARGWELRIDELRYLAHWVTPDGAPRRYDTRFFLAAAPAHSQQLAHDGTEAVAAEWVTPGGLLARYHDGQAAMLPPTVAVLEWLAAHATVADALTAAERIDAIPRIEPTLVTPLGWRISAQPLVAGEPTRLTPLVTRVLAPNPGVMTGSGTNTYLVGSEELVVVDPGPDDAAHLDAVAAAGDGRIKEILITHTHPDHWPGAAGLSERTGAPVLAFEARHGLLVDQQLADGDVITVAGATLHAIHTPGHASDHLCFWLDEERLLFTGDQVMHGSTVVLYPPEGDLHQYLLSLERLLALEPAALVPGHGHVFEEPRTAIGGIVEHRLARERKVVAALSAAQAPATVDDLLPAVYDDIEPGRLPIARGSLWAHLRALADTGRATTDGYDDLDGGRWQPA